MEDWESKLTEEELKHLKEFDVINFEGLLKNIKGQEEMRKQFPGPGSEPCWTCKYIGQKLGLI
jgi:hypothetical protein